MGNDKQTTTFSAVVIIRMYAPVKSTFKLPLLQPCNSRVHLLTCFILTLYHDLSVNVR